MIFLQITEVIFWRIVELVENVVIFVQMSFFAIGLVSLLASTLSFRSLPIESAGTNVQTVCQDSLGNMWFGGLDGITLYDGSRYTQFRHRADEADGIPDNRIYKLYCDSGGDIWVSHISGLSRYDRASASFRNHTSPDGIVSDIVQLDGDRLLTITGDRLWIFNREEERYSREEIPAALQEVRANTLYSDGKSLYIGDQDGCVYLCSPNLNRVQALPWSAPLRINCLMLDNDGRLWAGTEGNGLLAYSPEDNTQVHYRSSSRPGSLSSDYVRSLCRDHAGVLWIGTKNGLNIFCDGNFEVYYHDYYNERSLPHNSVCDIYCDKQGSLWLGTFYGGVCYCTPNASRFFTLDSRPGAGYLNGNIISAIVEAPDGSLWVGTNTGELNQLLPDGRFRHIRLPGGKPADQLDIKCLLISRRSGTLFVGADLGGLSYLRPSDGQLRPVREGQSLSIYGLAESDDGTLIVGASEGLFEYDERSGTLLRAVTDQDYSKVKSLMLDDEGILWVGQKTGISALRWESREFLPLPEPLSGVRYVEDTMRDSAGRLWASTSGGLICYNLRDSTLTRYTTQEGLPDNVVHGVEEDAEGRLWVSTNNGLCRLNPADGDICVFTTADGLPGNRFTPYAHCRGRGGEMYFGGLNWLVRFLPEEVCPGSDTMAPVLSGMEVNGNWRPVPPEAVRLKANERDVTLLFSIPDYISGQNGRFFYRMDGEGIRFELVTFVRSVREAAYLSDAHLEKKTTECISETINRYCEGKNVIVLER